MATRRDQSGIRVACQEMSEKTHDGLTQILVFEFSKIFEIEMTLGEASPAIGMVCT